MKSIVRIMLILLPVFANAQYDPTWGYINRQQADSLKHSLMIEKNDTMLMAAYRSLGFYYQESRLDSALFFHELQLKLAKKLDIKMWLADAYQQMGSVNIYLGNIIAGNESLAHAVEITSSEKNESSNWHYWTFSNSQDLHAARISILGMVYNDYGNLYKIIGDRVQAKKSFSETIKLGEQINNGKLVAVAYGNLSQFFGNDTSLLYARKAITFANKAGYKKFAGNAMLRMAQVFSGMNQKDSTVFYVYAAIKEGLAQNNLRTLSTAYTGIAGFYFSNKQIDSCFLYAGKLLNLATSLQSPDVFRDAYFIFGILYGATNNTDSAYKYERLAHTISDSLNDARIQQLTGYQKFAFNEQLRLKKINDDKTAKQNKLILYSVVGGLAAVLIVTLILYKNNRQKQQTNKVLESTLANLKATQSQLIQSEKMASLGELTAGIAHEIQNPLNFVNNFSEVNNELIDELKSQKATLKPEEQDELLNDIFQNNEKINHHGKRADAIVKGMLQHSQASKGQKEPTDINALVDEYVRLSYHGLRAKDTSFNTALNTDFDNAIGNINIIPQDIGRAIMNLLTNAFYAVNEKKKTGVENYEPTVSISTKKSGDKVEIKVSDNGNGISDAVKHKIFHPFFTTKPTGQGTGLGLSLTYDIIKAHGGELRVESKVDKGSKFIIQLPDP
ncbi:hypothetical protein BH11BAC3_BH11BAC3_42320 [soil metagenome]